MIYNDIIKGKNLYLRMIEFSDCNENYLNWLNDPEINQFLETRWDEQSIKNIKKFVENMRNSEDNYMFAIIKDEKHIGNIKIGTINSRYKFGSLSYFIGDKNYWGQGVATEAVRIMTQFGFEVLNLNRIQAGAHDINIASQIILEKNGYIKEGKYRNLSFLKEGQNYISSYFYGILKDEWKK